ncbi:MAG: ABC transporter ATP-binding protein [Treponema sp.]|jgi:peptide/nickel transport system ATP-binding protein|nr:ABC transporter ATP-binding protein [Treponema sp.]
MCETQQTDMDRLLKIDDLSVRFRMYGTNLEQRELEVISNLTLDVFPGEIVAVAGSSGSGKSLLAHAVMGLLPPNASATGTVLYKGRPLNPARQEALRGREIALIPQSVSFLDPLMNTGMQVMGKEKRAEEQKRIFSRLGLAQETAKLYPFQLSGGMARRILAATAIISGATLILADEPTPGMDPAIALEALQCFRELADSGKSIVLITHDIDIAMGIADRLAVFYAGTTLEVAPAENFTAGLEALRHPYTKALWNALPQNGFKAIPGFQPYAGELPSGCLFAPRCSAASPECEARTPPMRELRGGTVRCIHAA